MARYGEPVGHAGNIVADRTQPTGFIGAPLPSFRHPPGVIAVKCCEVADDTLRLYESWLNGEDPDTAKLLHGVRVEIHRGRRERSETEH